MAPSKQYWEKSKKACEAMKHFGITAATVRSALKSLLKAYERNWTYIEEDGYRVLLDAILEPEGPKDSIHSTMEIVKHGFEFLEDEEEEEETEPLKRKPRVRSEETAYCSTPAGFSSENGGKLLCLEYNNMDHTANKENEDVPPTPCSSEVDLASSSNGEVKFTFSICKPPLGSHSPDAVTKRVEDIYREKYQGFGTGFSFSLTRILKGICEGFMEQENASDSVGNKHCSSSLINIPKEQATVGPCSKHYRVNDITRGLEKHEISLVNEVDNEKLPTFTYIKKNVSRNTANVKSMLASISDEGSCSDCFGDCLSHEVPCACAAETGGRFAYVTGGLVDEKFLKKCIDVVLKPTKKDYFYCEDCPLERMKKRKANRSCKGHLVKKFIKECWCKCGCNGLNCGNRVVQRGIQAKLQVFMTPEGKGWGLRTLEDLPRGTFVCEYVGEIVTNSELLEQNKHNKNNKEHAHPVLLDAGWSSQRFLKDKEALYLDAMSFGNVARFINHRCVDANMVEIPVEVESPDRHYYHHAFFTTREVKATEELTWDYGIDFVVDNSQRVKTFGCKCGSKSCKAVKRYKRGRRGGKVTDK